MRFSLKRGWTSAGSSGKVSGDVSPFFQDRFPFRVSGFPEDCAFDRSTGVDRAGALLECVGCIRGRADVFSWTRLHSRMTRVKTCWNTGTVIHEQLFENWPEGTRPPHDAPLRLPDGGARGGDSGEGALDRAGAWISPLLALGVAAFLWFWAGTARAALPRSDALFLRCGPDSGPRDGAREAGSPIADLALHGGGARAEVALLLKPSKVGRCVAGRPGAWGSGFHSTNRWCWGCGGDFAGFWPGRASL